MKRQILEEQREARNLGEVNGNEKIRWEPFLREMGEFKQRYIEESSETTGTCPEEKSKE